MKNSSSAYMRRTPCSRQVSIIRSASSIVMQNGFSQTTCLPARAMSSVRPQCSRLGAEIVTISMSGSASSSWWSVYQRGTP